MGRNSKDLWSVLKRNLKPVKGEDKEDDEGGWEATIRSQVRRCVAVASLVREYERLNRTQCALVPISAEDILHQLPQLTSQFEEAMTQIVRTRDQRLDKLFKDHTETSSGSQTKK